MTGREAGVFFSTPHPIPSLTTTTVFPDVEAIGHTGLWHSSLVAQMSFEYTRISLHTLPQDLAIGSRFAGDQDRDSRAFLGPGTSVVSRENLE
jgi:hypothetical protein